MNESGGRVIVSPLNWGLGHATRCIPLIRALQEAGFEPVLAGDGSSLDLLAAEFPALRKHDLPSYNIRYSKNPDYFKLRLMLQGPGLLRTVAREKEAMEEIVNRERPVGIISDNRFGARSSKVASVYMTHQLQVKAGWMSGMATHWHQKVISRFDRCWVCDHRGEDSLAGDLSSDPGELKKVDWIGPLSRFSRIENRDWDTDQDTDRHSEEDIEKDIDIAVVISGPEPLRSEFQAKVITELRGMKENIVLVEGRIAPSQEKRKEHELTIYNYMLSEELESLIKRSRMVLSRSGYSSVMDLDALGAKVIFVPTPGQTEQEYLAAHLEEKGICHQVRQNEFSIDALERAELYPGFKTQKTSKNEFLTTLFDVFRQRRSNRSEE